jgi:hypothetical protein
MKLIQSLAELAEVSAEVSNAAEAAEVSAQVSPEVSNAA